MNVPNARNAYGGLSDALIRSNGNTMELKVVELNVVEGVIYWVMLFMVDMMEELKWKNA